MTIRTFIAASACVLVSLWPSGASACECPIQGSPCHATTAADAVFLGHVVSIDAESLPDGTTIGRVQMAVVESFRGVQVTHVTLSTPAHNCRYDFTMGESYVVYARRTPEGRLETSICTRTRPVSDAADDLAYLRSLAALSPGMSARVEGVVMLMDTSKPYGSAFQPFGGVRVTATGEGLTRSTRANARGEFQLTGLRRGSYQLMVTAPAGYEGIPWKVDTRDPRGCGPTNVNLRYDGRVEGRVVDRKGAGVKGLPIELVPAAEIDKPGGAQNRTQVWTGADGAFELRRVPPGEYLLGVHSIRERDGSQPFPRAIYPGVIETATAERITVGPGGRQRLRDFVVPASIELVVLDGIVVDSDNQPVRQATVSVAGWSERRSAVGPPIVTGDDGRFTLALVDGGSYVVHASRRSATDGRQRPMVGIIAPLKVSSSTSTLRIVVTPGGE